MRKIQEQIQKEYEAIEYDVVVAGGGIAGIAAALAAARNEAKKVLLIEKQYALGGLATLGLITIYLPLCDGAGTQVSFGIAEELLRLSIQHGAQAMYPDAWLEQEHGQDNGSRRKKQRFQVRYNAHVFCILAEQLLAKEGVEILYGTSVCSAITQEKRITALILENKSGRSAVCANSFIDATGDADVCVQAGENTVLFEQGNVLAGWYYHNKGTKNELKMLGYADIPDRDKKAEDLERDKAKKRYGGLDAKEVSEMMQASHRMLLEDFFANTSDSCTNREITTIPTIPQVRMTRRLAGIQTPDDDGKAVYSDSIGVVGNWRKSGPTYEIPFGSLYGGNIKNLLAAGRCISVTEAMWDLTRVIPVCAVTGEAAGTAAAMYGDFDRVEMGILQERLRKNGVKINREECYQ